MWSDPLVVSVLEMVVGPLQAMPRYANVLARRSSFTHPGAFQHGGATWFQLPGMWISGLKGLLWGSCSAMFSLAEFTKDVHSTPG